MTTTLHSPIIIIILTLKLQPCTLKPIYFLYDPPELFLTNFDSKLQLPLCVQINYNLGLYIPTPPKYICFMVSQVDWTCNQRIHLSICSNYIKDALLNHYRGYNSIIPALPFILDKHSLILFVGLWVGYGHTNHIDLQWLKNGITFIVCIKDNFQI